MAVNESPWSSPDASRPASPAPALPDNPQPVAPGLPGSPQPVAPGLPGGPKPVMPGLPSSSHPVPPPPHGAPSLTAGRPWPGASGPPVIGPPPRLSAGGPPVVGPPPRLSATRPLTPAASYGAWQGVLRPPPFVVSQGPPRPTYREPLPVRSPMVTAGAAAGAAWMLLFGLLATGARGYIWLTIIAGVLAWAASFILARFGDRGVAVGVAVSSGIAVAIAGIVVAYRLAGGDWVLW
ncbi:hypothetical protein [Dactylosporangium sp. NPDC050588]|uniref:hypothetical protein n=1 Tax=Dactylosporangium sp. NPDC050588 TaxID=3157211 RepID=UPI00340AE0CD